ncbi:MAG TPA: nickel-dependent lactate racemase [Candidatus Limnocylindrales bacterium]|nr:nickel-dependent lactate racemase [Candidatus Limnocylindrales bacterium]
MKKFSFAYGEEEFICRLNPDNVLGILRSKHLPSPASEEAVVRKAVENPIGSLRLRDIARSGEKACIIIGDMTRLWARYHVMVPVILEELSQAGVPDKDITIISATGAHRLQTAAEHEQLIGIEIYKRIKVVDHDCHADNLVDLGTTSRGTPVRINRRVYEANRTILTSGIVHHFLAGYGGGKKAIMPGVSSFESIMANHKLALNPNGPGLNPDVRAGKLKGNPLAEDMVEAARMAGADFIVNSIVNDEHKVALAVAGDLTAAHEAGCVMVDEYFGVPITELADLVIASCGGYPKDINLYQTYKTAHNMVRAMKQGGVGILISESCEGIGNDRFRTICTDFCDNEEREHELKNNYEIASFMGYTQLLWAQENSIIAVTSLPDEQIRAMGMIPARTLDEALSVAGGLLTSNYKGYLMPLAATTFPMFNK